MKPRGVYICDGTQLEAEEILHKLEERGLLHKLTKYENWYKDNTIEPHCEKTGLLCSRPGPT